MSESEHSEKKRGNPIVNYVQESFEELRKVTWPTRNQAIKLTFIVIGFCIVFALFVGLLDFGFNLGYRQLVQFSEKVAPLPADVASGEAAPITIDPSSVTVTPAAGGAPVKVTTSPVKPATTPAATPAKPK